MGYALPLPPVATVPVVGGQSFPVRRIYCVGRNYAAHTREMGHDPDREDPFFFMKPADAIVTSGSMPYPPKTSDLQHEIELVVALSGGGAEVPVADALGLVFGYAVGLDMTRRDIQGAAKQLGRPWDMGKGFDHSAPCGMISPVAAVGHISRGAITLTVNGAPRQSGDIGQLIWSVPEVITYLSGLVTLAPGDLIYSGTPAGVAAVVAGDRLLGHVDGLNDLAVTIT